MCRGPWWADSRCPHGPSPAFTRDVDVAVLVADDAAAELLVRSLTATGYVLSAPVEQEQVGTLAILPSLRVPVAGAGHLVALKLLARDDHTRPQDAADLRALRPLLTDEDQHVARTAVTLIEQRGFTRGRPLTALLERYLSEPAGTS